MRWERYGVFYWTGDIQSQIWSGLLSSATPVQSHGKSYQDSWLTSPCCPSSSLRLIKQFQLLLRAECWMLELRRWGRLRHERSSSETWYYQLLPQNIRDTAISRANNHTICWGGSWTLNILTDWHSDHWPWSPCSRSRDSPPTVAQKPDLSITRSARRGWAVLEICRPTPSWARTRGSPGPSYQTTWNISANY